MCSSDLFQYERYEPGMDGGEIRIDQDHEIVGFIIEGKLELTVGNPRARTTMIEMAWLWLRYQPHAALSRWFHERVGTGTGRVRRIAIVALARKLLIALWRFVETGLLPDGAELKA